MGRPKAADCKTAPCKRRCVNSLKKAIDVVFARKMTAREAAMLHNLPSSTITWYVRKLRNGEEIKLVPRGTFFKTFKDEYEDALAEHVVDMANEGMPMSKKEFLRLAYELAEYLKVYHRFSKTKQTAGPQFYEDFVKRHPEAAINRPGPMLKVKTSQPKYHKRPQAEFKDEFELYKFLLDISDFI